MYLSITIQSDFWVCILYTTFLYTVRYINACCYIDWTLWEFIACIMLCVCFYLKLVLRLSRFRIIVTHTKLKIKTSFKKYNITQLCILYVRDEKQLRGRQQFTLSFFNLTTLKTTWYPKLRYNIWTSSI